MKSITTVKNSCWEMFSEYFRILNGTKETQSSSKVWKPELPQCFGVTPSNTSPSRLVIHCTIHNFSSVIKKKCDNISDPLLIET